MSNSPSMTAPAAGNMVDSVTDSTGSGAFTPAQAGAEMPQRRKLLLAATSAVGAAGAAAVAAPFVASWFPSERAKAAGAPVDVDIAAIEPGMLLRAEWRGQQARRHQRWGQHGTSCALRGRLCAILHFRWHAYLLYSRILTHPACLQMYRKANNLFHDRQPWQRP
jgi:hypothetical protein